MSAEHKHAGHRQRLKDKVRKTNLRTLADHEIIELLLTYTIPRKDTNPIAHNLLHSFSGLSGVIDASAKDLQKLDGVGEETALFFKVLSELFEIYKENKGKSTDKLTSTAKCVEYFRKNYEVSSDEYMVVLCLSKMGKIVNSFYEKGYNDHEITIDLKEFASKINVHNANSIVVFHTHPHGDVMPTIEDTEATQRIYNICSVFGIRLLDHIIVNETEHFSFASDGLLDEIAKNCKLNYPDFAKIIEKKNKN